MDRRTYIFYRKAFGAAGNAAALSSEYDTVATQVNALTPPEDPNVLNAARAAAAAVDSYLIGLRATDPARFENERRLSFAELRTRAGAG